MSAEINEILENLLYWDTCPEDYKTKIRKHLNKQSKQEEVDYQKMFANCKLPNEKPDQLREAAEKVLHTYRNSPTEGPIIEALQELEKALNQNK